MIKDFYKILWALLAFTLLMWLLRITFVPGNAHTADDVGFLGLTKAFADEPKEDGTSESNTPKQLSNSSSESITSRLQTKLGLNAEAAKLYAKWIIGAPALVVCILIVMLLRPWRKKAARQKRSRPQVHSRPKPVTQSVPKTKPKPPATPQKDKLSDSEQVLQFFFALYKHQLGADAGAPTQLILVENRPVCPNETYEMRVQHNDEWMSRRMSIGLLGQGGGSRSKVFYVIYDSHMVIKIPAKPVAEFSVYNRQIAAEGAIVARLAPRECIVPRVSVILKALHTIDDSKHLAAEVLEDKYIQLLETTPSLQDYLKIGLSFAYFMDLAKYFFLSATLEEIHRGYDRLADEALQHPELLWDQHSFVCRYGEDAGALCHELQEAYYRCEGQLRRIVEETAGQEDVPSFQLRHWFLTHLIGEQIDAGNQNLPVGAIGKINQLLGKVVKAHYQQVERYRQHVRIYIRETRFLQHRTRLENLVANTLDLLAWIGTKGLALRDLKPENLFVAGNPDEYPVFLNDPKKFSIGLIDVETAVAIDAQDPNEIPQPQLAGTPLYATPSHLISNTILQQVYPDLAATLHLQDWYATIAIIYKVVIGDNLFAITGKVFPEILKRIKFLDPAGANLEKDVARINRLFWNSSMAEFKEAMLRHSDTFARVEVAVPASILPEIVKALHKDSDGIAKTITNFVADQSFFTSEDKKQFLLDASTDKIGKMKKKLAQEMQSSAERAQQRSQALEFFEQLEQYKYQLQRKLEAAAALKSTGSPIGADQLLPAMYERVFSYMYPTHWPALTPTKWQGSAHLPTDITTYQATM